MRSPLAVLVEVVAWVVLTSFLTLVLMTAVGALGRPQTWHLVVAFLLAAVVSTGVVRARVRRHEHAAALRTRPAEGRAAER